MFALKNKVLLGSGAIGTCLRRTGAAQAEPVELLNLKNQAAVSALHAAYCTAGSDILITNTFAANPMALDEIGMAGACFEINSAGVRLAREAAVGGAMVWASAGPLGLGLRLDDFTDAQLLEAYRRQCSAFKDADAVVLETFTEPREAAAALSAAVETGLPVVFQVGNTGGGPRRWERVDGLVELALSRGAAAVGANCRHPDDIVETIAHIAGRCGLPLTASPNAGHPRIERGAVIYEFTPESLVAAAAQILAQGAAVVGGCCGTGPEHIRALAAAGIKGRPVVERAAVAIEIKPSESPREPAPRRKNIVRELIRSGRFLVSVEIRAERTKSLEEIIRGAKRAAAGRVDMFDVPDNPAAAVGRDAIVTAAALQEKLGIPSIPHMSVTQANILKMHSAIIGCGDMGLKGVLAVTGDAPSIGHLGSIASRVTDLKSSVELLRLIRQLREGKMANGEEITAPPDLCAGCAISRGTPGQLKWLREKMDAGAEFVFSQPVFTLDDFRRLRDAVKPLGIRLFPGLMPLTSLRGAEFLASGRIPGVSVPGEILKIFDGKAPAADQRRAGIEYACGLASSIAAESAGLYLIMPFGKSCYDDTALIVRAAGR